MMSLRVTARAVRDAAAQARFRLWAAHLDLELRRHGGRLRLEAPHGARLEAPPHLRILGKGDGDGTLTLRFGEGVWFGRNVLLEVYARGTNLLEIGDRAYALDGVRILLRDGSVRLAEDANLRDYTLVKSSGDLRLGKHVAIAYYSSVQCTQEILLEDYVSVAERVTILDSHKAVDGSDTFNLRQPLLTDPVRIGRNALIGTNSVVLAGVTIGENCVVGGGSLVAGHRDYPPGHLIAGTPAKPLRPLPAAAPDAASASRSAS